jgi:peptidoglycan/xylan/chitin deacetylase (PgdA/CDA1 family)
VAVIAVLVALATVTGCGGKPTETWHSGTRAGDGTPAGAAGDDAAPPSGQPQTSPDTSPSARPGGKPESSGQPSQQQFGTYLARLPHFPPAPPPQANHVPAGPQAGWYTHIQTDQPVAFLTIDDGWAKLPVATALIRAAHVPVTLFLTINAIRDNPDYFKELQANGADIQAHTITHVDLKGKPYDLQKREACGSADQLGAWYGKRPTLFRPPFGDHDATTLRATHDCGMKAAFFWKETVNTGVVRYQEGSTVQKGDIILMHFRPAFADDFVAALTAIQAAGLTPAALSSYVD